MNVIPKAWKAEELDARVSFGAQTAVTGDFPQTSAYARTVLERLPNGEKNRLVFRKNPEMAREEYSIECSERDIAVEAAEEAGAFYAVQTLIQLSEDRGDLQAVKISDRPKYGYRGFMLDCARHFWTIDKIKQVLDVMANLKMNIFHWHLTEDQGWRAEIKKYPLLTQKGSIRKSTPVSLKGYWQHKEAHDDTEYGRGLYYTQEQMKEIVAYAKERHIDIIPEVDMPGHMVAAIACYPELSCTGEETEVSDRWGVMDNICCCGKENVYRFARDVIDELCEIFPYQYFHIGGDEVPKKRWKTCPACQAKIKELGLKDENALQGYFNHEISEYLKSKGRSMIGWNEILDGAEQMDRSVIAQWWVFHSKKNENELNWMKNGGKCVLSICDYVYMDHAYAVRPLSKTYSLSARKIGVQDDSNIIGMEIPQWTEYIRTEEKFDMNTYPRLITYAEVCWTAEENKNYPDFERRLEAKREYFKRFGFEICPQPIYRGKTTPWSAFTMKAKWKRWNDDPNFEVDVMRRLK